MPELSNVAIELCGVRTFPGGRAFVFAVEVTVPTTSRAFLEIKASDVADGQAVVFVETDRFVAAWRREPYGFNQEAANGMLDPARSEKYQAVENDFARSRERPVPLAYVVCRKNEEKKTERVNPQTCGRRYVELPAQPYYVDFNQGVTRTFWLIAHGVRAFPVLVDAAEACALHDEAGLPEMPPMTVRELLELQSSSSFASRQPS